MTHYYEDLAVGDVFETSGYTIQKDEIVDFAEQFDPQPFHVDEEAAKDSMFGELVASGLHTLCLSVRLFVTEIVQGEADVANMGGLGMDNLEWHEPVRPDDTLTLRVEVLEKTPSESREDRGYVEFRRSVTVDETEVMSITSVNIVRREDAADEE
ncbi:MaoC family dehydratase [Natronorubrum daqingense]|uniref:Acyl dehydratase n=1 Tax=Natronorubrum daqingense TaxID=588898 RepID=A0A1N7AEE0_9EURY|nr:MaoC family dehydratase [Natronorubrum daqingense]APX98014.1 acyl dehydratase [Natronorubrum daqingense]SIR37432.1 Acyl dehydratase [Natronorubrum daqingense]